MKVLMILMEGRIGMFQYAALLANSLSKTEQVTVIAPQGSEKKFFENSVKLVLLPVGDTKKHFVTNTLNVTRMLKFMKVIQDEHPDIIHLHNPSVIWTCPFLPRLKKYKIIITLPDGKLLPGQRRPDKLIAQKIHLKYADGLIVLSEIDKKIVQDQGIKKKCFVIPHGENYAFTQLKQEIPEENSALFFGGINEYKGLEYLIQAANLIYPQIPDAKVIIAAHGDLERYKNLLQSSHNVELHNEFIPQEDVAIFFRRARVVVLPYTLSVHSGVIPIAYSFGKPVVATTCIDSEQIRNGETGLVVPPRDEVALAKAITTLLKDTKLRTTMGQNALIRAKEDFNWDRIAQKTLDAYGQVIGNNGEQ